jgi:hypothetical protein
VATIGRRDISDAQTLGGHDDRRVDSSEVKVAILHYQLGDALLLDVLPGIPVITVDSAAQLIGRSVMRTGEAIHRLETAGSAASLRQPMSSTFSPVSNELSRARPATLPLHCRPVVFQDAFIERLAQSPRGETLVETLKRRLIVD